MLSSVTRDTMKLEIEYLHQAGVKAARRIARLAAFLSAFLHPRDLIGMKTGEMRKLYPQGA